MRAGTHLAPGEGLSVVEGELEDADGCQLDGAAPELALDLCIALKRPLAAFSISREHCRVVYHL